MLVILALNPLLPQRKEYYPHNVGVSQGATLLSAHCSLVTLTPGPSFSYFFIIRPNKKNKNDVEFDFSIGTFVLYSCTFF